jgi:hypothetical protein
MKNNTLGGESRVALNVLKCITNSDNHIVHFNNLPISLRFLLRIKHNQQIKTDVE